LTLPLATGNARGGIPRVPSDPDPRILELATGFALGDLDDAELSELYDRLRAPGEAGAEAARAAWDTLYTIVDLRAELGTGFQDALYLQLTEEFAGGDPAFAQKLRARLGHSRPRLTPVEPPAPPPRRHPWLIAALAAALLIAAAAVAVALAGRGEAPVATVAALAGSPTLDGRTLAVGAAIDRRQIVVPAGAQLTLAWPDGARATIAGPAAAVAGPRSLSIPSGQLWCSGGDGFALGLPDRATALALPRGTTIAITIADSRSTLAVTTGRIADSEITLEAGQAVALAHPGRPYPWRRDALPAGAAAVPGADHARWRVTGTATWNDGADHLRVRCGWRSGGEIVIELTPGRARIVVDGTETQRLALSGAPLAERILDLRGDARALSVAIGTQRIEVGLGAAIEQVTWEADGAARLTDATFATGPERQPPLVTE